MTPGTRHNDSRCINWIISPSEILRLRLNLTGGGEAVSLEEGK